MPETRRFLWKSPGCRWPKKDFEGLSESLDRYYSSLLGNKLYRLLDSVVTLFLHLRYIISLMWSFVATTTATLKLCHLTIKPSVLVTPDFSDNTTHLVEFTRELLARRCWRGGKTLSGWLPLFVPAVSVHIYPPRARSSEPASTPT